MARFGKISTLKKQLTNDQKFEKSLETKGYTRLPGTGVFKYTYKELDGKYRTGLDPEAGYIKRIQNDLEREVEIERVTKLKEKLEGILSLDLGPRSKFWNHALSVTGGSEIHVQPEKLMDGDNYFDFNVPLRELQFAWLRVHPTIAPSFQAWESGAYPDCQFYVVDDEVENDTTFKKKQRINKAIVILENLSTEKRRKVARQLGLPVSEDTKEDVVYNLIDNTLRQGEFKNGIHAKLDPVNVFTSYAKMDGKLLDVKDTVKLAILHNVYRIKDRGKVFKGEYELAKDEDTLVKFFMDEDNQKDLIMLEQEIKSKMLTSV